MGTENTKDISEALYEIKKVFSDEIRETLKQADSNTKKLINAGYIMALKNKKMTRTEKADFYLNYANAYLDKKNE